MSRKPIVQNKQLSMTAFLGLDGSSQSQSSQSQKVARKSCWNHTQTNSQI